jgi:CHASE2 domain-containing sensor protein
VIGIGNQRIALAGAALTAGLGLLAWSGPSWSNGSYDLLFRFGLPVDLSAENVVLVEMDDESEAPEHLGQPSVQAWDRTLHAQLLNRLKELGAELVVFDVFFRNTGTNLSGADRELLKAARDHGNVLFAAITERAVSPDGGSAGATLRQPLGKAVGLENIGLVEEAKGPIRIIRQHYTNFLNVPSLAWRAAERTMAHRPVDPQAPRWINYYARPGSIPHVSYYRVLSNSVPPSIQFSNKVVFVGARADLGPTGGSGTDYFDTPFGEQAPGVEINALTYLNLVRRDWLRRWPPWAEGWALALLGIAGAYRLASFRPRPAVRAGALAAGGVLVLTLVLFWFAHFWFPWLIVVTVQIPCAVACSIWAHAGVRDKSPRETFPAVTEPPLSPSGRLLESGRAPSGPSDLPAPVIPDHELLRLVGRGAYGEVWLARDVLGTYHAVKLVYRQRFAGQGPYEREFRGVQHYTPISRLHPGWVHILHVGRNDDAGYFFSIMEAGDDETRGQRIEPDTYVPKTLAGELQRRGRFRLEECVQLGLALTDALEHLHQHRLIHRDIKPSNVIFVRGLPKFTDIGLVTEMESTAREVSYLGTEGYIAPEGPGSPAADVYSLGKLLYEIAMGRDRREFPEPPSTLADQTDASHWNRFNDILYKACALEVRERYSTAAAFRADLLEWQKRFGQPAGA